LNDGLLLLLVGLGGSSVTGQTVVVTMISVVTMVLWLGQLVTVVGHWVMVLVVLVVIVLVVYLVVEEEVVEVSGSSLSVSVSHSSSEVELVVSGFSVVVVVAGGEVIVVDGASDEVDTSVEVLGEAEVVDEAL
jgi:Ca2+/Na+ antiporter